MIDVKGLQKNYGGLQVLKGVDLTINKGETLGVVGESGCGKSITTLAIMGLTALGVAVIPGLFFARGFLLAFSTACFYRVFGGQGVWPAVVLFGLPALFWAPALFLSGLQSLSASLWLLRRWRGQERGSGPFSPVYWLRLAVLCGLMLLAGGVECSVAPGLLRAAAKLAMGT